MSYPSACKPQHATRSNRRTSLLPECSIFANVAVDTAVHCLLWECDSVFFQYPTRGSRGSSLVWQKIHGLNNSAPAEAAIYIDEPNEQHIHQERQNTCYPAKGCHSIMCCQQRLKQPMHEALVKLYWGGLANQAALL